MSFLTYIIALFWCCLTQYQALFDKKLEPDQTDFLSYNGIEIEDEYNLEANKKNIYDQLIIFIYFAFTTITTVGFGDYHPVNSFERSIICFVLLFGVTIQSYIMSVFINVVNLFLMIN